MEIIKPSALMHSLLAALCLLPAAARAQKPGALPPPHLTVHAFQPPVMDKRDGSLYHAGVQVKVDTSPAGGQSLYQTRFVVYVPHQSELPLAKRTALLLGMLYNEDHSRLQFDHPFQKTLKVWITDHQLAGLASDAGGEQLRSEVYLFNLFARRSPAEWLREIAHEYGHYALPGVTGFLQPEAWANGFLGQRLFLYWLYKDARAGRIDPESIPFVTLSQLHEYLAIQVYPLMAQIAEAPAFPAYALKRTDTAGLDFYTGLAVYVDALYGDKLYLNALEAVAPASPGGQITAPDFYQGVLRALENASTLTLHPPLPAQPGSSQDFLAWLPHGVFHVSASVSFQISRSAGGITQTPGKLLVHKSGWYRLSMQIPEGSRQALITLSAGKG